MRAITPVEPLPSASESTSTAIPVKPSNVHRRGFASMSPERRREIASLGGKAVPDAKRSFSMNQKLAKDAGQKGGKAVPREKRSFFRDRKLAARSGREGGLACPDETRTFARDRTSASAAGRKGGVARHAVMTAK